MGKLFRTSFAALAAALFSMTMISCGPDEPDTPGGDGNTQPTTVAVTGVTLSKTTLSLVEGGSETLTATIAPSNATNKNVSWSSSATSVATVDNAGKVTAVKAGSATITVTTADGNNTATCSVTVTSKAVSVTGVSLDKETLEITEGETAQLKATISPDDATNKEVEWSTSDSKIATVDSTGKITAVAPGEATITVKTKDGGKTATCKVAVNANVIEATGIAVEPATQEIKEGQTLNLTVKFLPEGAVSKPVSWRSTNDEVATVSGGTVTAIKAGKTKIFARVDGTEIEAFCDLTVLQDDALKGIAFSADKYEITIGAPKAVELIFTPSYAANKNVTYSSSNTSIATVAADGTVTGLKEGETTITAKSEEGGFEATCAVVVTSAAKTGVYWTQNNYLMLNGESLGIQTYYTPGTDPEGNMYYVHVDMYGKLLINKNGVDIHTISAQIPYDGKSVAGGGYFFIEIERDYRKNLSVLRVSDSGEEKEFSLYKGDKSYVYNIHDVYADSKGNLYVVGDIKDEYNVYVAMMWTLTVDGKVSQTPLADGSRDTDCYAVAASGNDVWCLVWEGSSSGKNILAAYKNGKRQYQLCEHLCRRGGMFCDIGIAGNDVYAVVNNDYENNNRTSKIEVYKNGKVLYELMSVPYAYIYSFFVTPGGDTYVSADRDMDSGSLLYVFKNDAIIYTPEVIAWNLFVKE